VKNREPTKGPTSREKQYGEMLSIVEGIKAGFIEEKMSIEDAVTKIKSDLDLLLPKKEMTDEELVEGVVSAAPRGMPNL